MDALSNQRGRQVPLHRSYELQSDLLIAGLGPEMDATTPQSLDETALDFGFALLHGMPGPVVAKANPLRRAQHALTFRC